MAKIISKYMKCDGKICARIGKTKYLMQNGQFNSHPVPWYLKWITWSFQILLSRARQGTFLSVRV